MLGYYVTLRRALEAAAAAEERNDEDDVEEVSEVFEFEDGDDDVDDDVIDEMYVLLGFELMDEENVSGLDVEEAAARLDVLNFLFDDDEDDEVMK